MPRPRSTISEPAHIEPYDAAVIDVGSNSVRLVGYRVDGRQMTPTLNEKTMAALGRRLRETGKLSPQGVESATQALKRFAGVIGALGVTRVHAVATAAVREASDGPAFARFIEKEIGFKLRVLSGADEARLSALGVLAGAPEAAGVVGDLGGSSLELVEVHKGVVGRGETFPLGHLALSGDGFNYERIAALADAALAGAQAIDHPNLDLYAVGGVWRAIGKLDMARRKHPLRVLHHHEISRDEALGIADFVRRATKKQLTALDEDAAKRAESLPFGAAVLERLLMRGSFNRVILSAFGIREGVLLEQMDAAVFDMHPLIAGAEAFAGSRARAFGRALGLWMEPAFEDQPVVFSADHDARLRAAAARLADLGGAFHPDQRIEIMYDLVLRAPLAAINHKERAFLAASVHHRYTKSPPHSAAYEQLLGEGERKAAMAVGAALRLGADISARSEDLLAHFDLSIADGALVLGLKKREADLLSDQAIRRLDSLGAALNMKTGVSFI